MQEQENESIFEENISPGALQAIYETGRWGKMLAVAGYAIGAFVVIVVLFNGTTLFKTIERVMPVSLEGLYGLFITVFFIAFFIIAAILYFLYKGATLLQQGAQQNNTTLIAEGFSFFKKFFLISAIVGSIGLLINIFTLLS
ncbi:MAG: hypothetical protein ACK5NK_00395 [Niabella sp.]